jgi:uncharacterized protein YaiL (DUF2058 family)
MGSLRDEMLKKGLVSSKRDRHVRHDEQQRKKQLGGKAVAEEDRRRQEQQRQEREDKRRADQQLEVERREADSDDRAEDRIPTLIRTGMVPPSSFGNRKFYFVTRENTVSFIEVPGGTIRKLAAGAQAVVEADGVLDGEFCVVTGDVARQIYDLEPDRVRFWNGTGKVGKKR